MHFSNGLVHNIIRIDSIGFDLSITNYRVRDVIHSINLHSCHVMGGGSRTQGIGLSNSSGSVQFAIKAPTAVQFKTKKHFLGERNLEEIMIMSANFRPTIFNLYRVKKVEKEI